MRFRTRDGALDRAGLHRPSRRARFPAIWIPCVTARMVSPAGAGGAGLLSASWSRHILLHRRVLFSGFFCHNFAENGLQDPKID